jgi:hypothetical protein
MPRIVLALTIILAFVLSACATATEPTITTTPAPPTEPPPTLSQTRFPTQPPLATDDGTPDFQPTTIAQGFIENAGLEGQVTILPQGTLAYAEQTEQPNAPTQAPRAFRSLTYVQVGGAGNQELIVELNADGTLTRNGTAGAIPPVETAAVAAAIDRLRIFDLVGSFTGPLQSENGYRYGLTVVTDNGDRSIEAVEGYTPDALMSFFYNLSQLGITPFPEI